MILAVDIGNSNVTIGIFKNEKLLFVSRLHTKRQLTKDQCVMELIDTFRMQNIDYSKITGAIISSVVPSITGMVSSAIEEIIKVKPMILNLNLKFDLTIKIPQPDILGTDLIAGAVGAVNMFKLPIIVVDLGTATTFSVIDENKNFLGCSIAPGVKTSLDSLVNNTELLSPINLEVPEHILGTNSSDSIASGIIYGTAAMVDGLCSKIEKEINKSCTIVTTGGFADLITKKCNATINYCENLLLIGLKHIYDINQ